MITNPHVTIPDKKAALADFQHTCRQLLAPADTLLTRFMRKGGAALQPRDRSEDNVTPIARVSMHQSTP